jgi:hypothetical protein
MPIEIGAGRGCSPAESLAGSQQWHAGAPSHRSRPGTESRHTGRKSSWGQQSPASCHTFHHFFATHQLERGQDIRRAMIDTHGLNRGPLGVSSPAGFV